MSAVPAEDAAPDMGTLLEAFQIADSTFPIGTFNHSFGMETYVSEGTIRMAPDFDAWIASYFSDQYRSSEGLLVLLAFRALEDGDTEMLWRLDRELFLATLAQETRHGTQLIARQMLGLLLELEGTQGLLGTYAAKVRDGSCPGSPALAFAIFAQRRGLSARSAYLLYGYSVASTLVQNAVRSVPLGQRQGQAVLRRIIRQLVSLYPESAALEERHLGATSPGLEIAQMRHETLEARLFMS
jgi:urease accessory protein